MKSVIFAVISALLLSHNLLAMEMGSMSMGSKISRLFETYKFENDSGLKCYELSAHNGLKITTRWENMAKVNAFFRSNAHKELKSFFGLNQQSAQGLKLVRDVKVENHDNPVEVINAFDGSTFTIIIRNY